MSRRCPFCTADSPKVVTSIEASSIVEGNATYRAGALSLLGVLPETRYDIVRCTQCDFVYARELPDVVLLSRLYGDVIDSRVEKETAAGRSWIAHQLQLAASLLSRVAAFSAPRILDYGCGDGVIVKALNAAGIACIGFEPYARTADDPNVTDSVARVSAAAPFSGIILSDVVEHVSAPLTLLQECHELMDAGGWICVSVPDFSAARLDTVLRDLGTGAAATRELNPWEHLNYFSPRSLAAMLERAGFHVDAEPAKNFGLRTGSTGLRRLTNTVRSAGRLLSFAARATPGSTTIFAQK